MIHSHLSWSDKQSVTEVACFEKREKFIPFSVFDTPRGFGTPGMLSNEESVSDITTTSSSWKFQNGKVIAYISYRNLIQIQIKFHDIIGTFFKNVIIKKKNSKYNAIIKHVKWMIITSITISFACWLCT